MKKREKVIDLPGMTGPGVGSVKIKAIDSATENYLAKKGCQRAHLQLPRIRDPKVLRTSAPGDSEAEQKG